MAHLQYMPGDPRLVDQLVYELKSKGIFDQFRKECIADVDTRPAYQNLRQRVESSVSTFLTRQTWKSDLNKNQLREKLRKHILDGNYLEQGVERIVDQVVNPKVAAVFIPQVEDLVYNYLGIPRKRTTKAELAEKCSEDLLPTDLESVSPGSVKSNAESKESEGNVQDMDIDSEEKPETIEELSTDQHNDLVEVSSDSASMDKSSIPLPTEEIKLENIPAPENSPKPAKIELENIELKNIELPREPNLSTDIPLPDEVCISKDENFFKPLIIQSEDSNTSSSSSIRRNMSPITPVRNFDDENSCDAQQAFENNSNNSNNIQNDEEPSSFRFNIAHKDSTNDSPDVKNEKKETEHLSYQFTNQVKINTYNTPLYDDSSNSHNLQIDYESDANTNTSKTNDIKPEVENSEDSKKDRKDDKKPHKSSHRSRDSSRHSSSKDKHSNSRDSSRHDKKPSNKDDKSKSSKEREKSKDRVDKKDSSKHKSSHKSSSSSSKDKHRSSSSSHRHSSKSSDDRKSSGKDSSKEKGSEKDKERSSEKDKSSKDRRDSKTTHKDKDRKSSKKDKDKKKEKKDTDDHYSSSGRGNHSRRSTDRDSNDGSSSSKGSQNQNNSKSSKDSKKESKSNSSKSENTSTSGESTSPSEKEQVVCNSMHFKPIVRVDNHLETPIANPPRLPFVPDVTLKKPKFANNFEEAKKMMKMRKFLAEEQKRMNQEAALLLEFQANVRPSLSQVYSSIPGPELEFACITHAEPEIETQEEKIEKESVIEIENNVEIVYDTVTEGDYTANIETNPTQVTRDIINDIIGVPVIEDTSEQTSFIIIDSEIIEKPNAIEDSKYNDSYDENKPFSQLVDEITKCGKVTEITVDPLEESIAEIVDQNISTEFEITVIAETLSEADVSEILEMKEEPKITNTELHYFAEHDKFNAELEKHKFSNFLKEYIKSTNVSNKMYLMNCDSYEESIVKEMATKFGDFEVVNFHKNGHLVPNKNIVKDVPLCNEIALPIDTNDYEKSLLFSPVKSECSFELSSDYDAKLDEIVNKKSRQEVMEIILGGAIDESPNKMPTIDYYTEISDSENTLTIVEDIIEDTVNGEVTESSLKRRIEDVANGSRSVLTPNKIRKISDSDLISSTTEETEEVSNNNKVQSANTRSKFLGRARRVGLPRPKRSTVPNSPSSDKSVENYAQNTPSPPNGKLKTPRSKVQRYNTSDLYKPKLHYLSRRNNIS